MRKYILAAVSFAFMSSIAHGGSFIVMDKAPSQNSSIQAREASTIFDLYGPAANECVGESCPSQKELERLARKGTTVMKVSGGDIQMLDNVFAPIPKPAEQASKPKEVSTADEPKIVSLQDDMELREIPAISEEIAFESPDGMPDEFKTGPLSNGDIQADVAGVDTEFLPDLEPQFETELLSSIDDPAIALENVSSTSMEALSNAL